LAGRSRIGWRAKAHLRRSALQVGLLLASAVCQGQQNAPDAHVDNGKYLAAAGNCLSCHTRPGGSPFAGGVAFPTPLGVLYSTNITPEPETGIGRWSAADLQRAMHEGIARDGSHLFPAFPYTAFTKVSDADVADIYAYLRTLRPVRYTPPANGAMFSMRWGVGLWNELFFTPGRLVATAAKSPEWNRGAYLVEGLGHCSACHTPRNAFLAEQPDKAYTGGHLDGEVAKGKTGHWFAVNLTSAKHGLAAWSIADLEKYFRTGVSLRGGTFGPMNEVIVNSLKLLSPADQHAMAVYVKSLQGAEYAGEPVPPQLVSAGAAIYKERCEKCHGASGRGGFFSGPPLAGSAVVQGEDPASLINTIVHGPVRAQGVSYGAWETMSAYGDVLDDSEIVAVSNFVRGNWGNRAGPVSLESVSSQR
jgi:mono/diheme cytochrome c family protein